MLNRNITPYYQRWSPWGQILKSLALASRPQVLENWPVLGSRTAVFFELLKFCGALEKVFRKRFFTEIARKIFVKTFFFFEIAWKIFVKPFFFEIAWKNFWRPFFFLRALALVSLVLGLGLEHSCPWPWECLSSERLSLALASDFFCVLGFGLGLEPCVLDSTSAYYHVKSSKRSFSKDVNSKIFANTINRSVVEWIERLLLKR